MPIINSSYFGSGGTDTSDATAVASQILAPYTAYVASGKVTGTMPSQGAQTITPGTTNKTIQSGRYLSGTQTILGDAQLIPSNIRRGVDIFGVVGTLDERKSSDYSYQSSSQTSQLLLSLSVYDLGTPNIVCVNATASVENSSTVVSGIYSSISSGNTQGTAYITCGNGNAFQTTSIYSGSVNRSILTLLNTTGDVNIYLPTGYTFGGRYNVFVSFFL